MQLIHENQYGFIKSRTIQDCLSWAYEYLHQCHKSRKELVIFKLDFEKAFDKVEHSFILKVLERKGFGPKWCQWIRLILNSATSAVLLNGVPGSVFHCKRGVRQGDPLSPLLFVLAADFLQTIVNQAMRDGFLTRPLPLTSSVDFPIIQYVDDTLLILNADEEQLLFLKNLLIDFGNATGLKVNYDKSNLIPINTSEERLQVLLHTLQCQKGSLPFTYLGLPLSTTKPSKEFFMPILQSAQRRLSACSMYLSYGDKLRLVNSVLSSLPTFYMSTLRLYQWVLKEFDKYRRHCLWRRKDLEEHGHPLAAWEMVCKPKDQGGLGVVNLSTQNRCLLMKHLHKFYNKANLPWVKLLWEVYYVNALPPAKSRDISFWWRDCLKSLADYKGLAKCSIGIGSSIMLWTDSWSDVSLNLQFSHLYSFTVNESISLHQMKSLEHLSDLFHLPLSNEEFAQFQVLQDVILNIPDSADPDSWEVFGNNTSFKVSKAYKHFVGQHLVCPIIKKLWKTCCQSKHKVFFWLLLQDRLNTRQLLQRKSFFLPDYSCAMCGSLQLESRTHLFFECPFALMCWQYICPGWLIPVDSRQQPYHEEIISSLLATIGQNFSLDIVILGCWSIWRVRNDFLFKDITPNLYRCKKFFKEELALLVYKAKRKSYAGLADWVKLFI
jgi:hypothetical protein